MALIFESIPHDTAELAGNKDSHLEYLPARKQTATMIANCQSLIYPPNLRPIVGSPTLETPDAKSGFYSQELSTV